MGARRNLVILLPSVFLCSALQADTIVLKNQKELKGLIVEEHEDRIVLSTEGGEIPLLRRGIQKIDYDDAAQNFLQAGRTYESKQRYGEALGYYEKAVELNPDLEDARKSAARVRNLFWSKSAEGPVGEIERRQSLYENWGRGKFSPDKPLGAEKTQSQVLEEGLGLRLVKKGDNVCVYAVLPKKDAALAGLMKGDRLAAIDGRSLRYLGVETVTQRLISPRHTGFTLEYDRDLRVVKSGFEKEFRDLGFELKLMTQGVVVTSVSPKSVAAQAGLRENDLLLEADGESMRYVPLKKWMPAIQRNPAPAPAVLTVRRSVLLTRK